MFRGGTRGVRDMRDFRAVRGAGWAVGMCCGLAAATAMACPPGYTHEVFTGPECPPPFTGAVQNAYPRALLQSGKIYGVYKASACSEFYDDLPFTWTPETGFKKITGLPAQFSTVSFSDVNESEVAVGHKIGGGTGPVRYANGVLQVLPLPRGFTQGYAKGINESGVIVGYTTSPSFHALLWQDGQVVDLSADFGGTKSVALDINSKGQIVGQVGGNGSPVNGVAMFWEDGKATQIPMPANAKGSAAIRILDDGTIAGQYTFLEGSAIRWRTFLYRDGVFTDLGIIPGYTDTNFGDVIANGLVAGSFFASGAPSWPYVWIDGEFFNLNEILGLTQPAWIIGAGYFNASGKMAALGYFDPGDGHFEIGTYVLTPLPSSPADLDCNHIVDIDDLKLLLDSWHQLDSPCDINADGLVDGEDLGLLLADWSA